MQILFTVTPNNANPRFALVITPGFYVHPVEVTDQDPACGSLYINLPNGDSRGRTARCSLMSMPRT